jgi:hypothetical protein
MTKNPGSVNVGTVHTEHYPTPPPPSPAENQPQMVPKEQIKLYKVNNCHQQTVVRERKKMSEREETEKEKNIMWNIKSLRLSPSKGAPHNFGA